MDGHVIDEVWALAATQGELRKRHRWTLGQWTTQSYDRAYLYAPERHSVRSLPELHTLLDELRHRPDTCVIRGALDASLLDPDGAYRGPAIVRRQHERDPDAQRHERAWWRPSEHHWVMLDLDTLEGDVTPAQARSMLPPAWRYAACVWHYSGSHGVAPGTRLHLAFWLARPACDASLREYWRSHKLVDTALFSAVQIHYTADPLFVGAPDPVRARMGYLAGGEVDEPRLVGLAEWTASLEAADAEKRAREAASRAALARIPIDAAIVSSVAASSRLADCCAQIEASDEGTRHAAINRAAYVAGLYGSPWDDASKALLAAAQSVLPPDRWDEADRTIADGYAAGARAHSRATPVADVRPDLRAPVEATLADAREQITGAVHRALRERGRLVLATGTGTGKSTAIARELAAALEDDAIGGVTVCVPTRALAAQWAAALPGAVIRPTRDSETDATEGRYLCARLAEYRAAEHLEQGGGAALCDACWLHSSAQCPYVAVAQRHDRGDVLITTHVYGAATQDWRDVVVIDESPHAAVLGSVRLDADQIERALTSGDISTDTPDDLRLYAESGYRGDLGTVTYHGAVGARALGLLTAEVCDPAAAAEHPGWEALDALARASARDWLGVQWSGGGLSIPVTRPLGVPEDATLIVADATATPDLSQYLYGACEVLSLATPREATVVQYARSISRRSVTADGRGWRSQRDALAWQQYHALVRSRCQRPLWVLIRAMLDVPDVQRDLSRDLADGRVIWYRGTLARGANTWPEIDGVALADYHPRRAVVRATAEQLVDGVALLDQPIDEHLRAWMPEIAWQLRDAEILQAAGRLRGAGTIIFAATSILEALHPDELVEAAMTADERLRFEVARHGAWRLAPGERPSVDLLQWTVEVYGRRERWVTGDIHTRADVASALRTTWGYPRDISVC